MEAKSPHEFYGEVGVTHRPFQKDRQGWLDDDCDRLDPAGSMYGRRSRHQSCFLSGMPQLSPAEYPVPGLKFYDEYCS